MEHGRRDVQVDEQHSSRRPLLRLVRAPAAPVGADVEHQKALTARRTADARPAVVPGDGDGPRQQDGVVTAHPVGREARGGGVDEHDVSVGRHKHGRVESGAWRARRQAAVGARRPRWRHEQVHASYNV